MKHPVILIFFMLLAVAGKAQQLNQVTYSQGSTFSYFTFLIDREVLIRISEDGRILEYGTEVQSIRSNNYYSPKLQPYGGRVEYYGPEADSASRGKIKSIGSATITYFGSYEQDFKKGKIKTLGNLLMDYYSSADNAAMKDKLRSIGRFGVEYYASFDNEALRGKIKAIGSTYISYYTNFDDKMLSGKLKSIGSSNYTWYSSYDREGLRGSLKSGSPKQIIDGISFNLW